jgi:hypothetical protein
MVIKPHLGVDISEINPNILMKKYPFKFSD